MVFKKGSSRASKSAIDAASVAHAVQEALAPLLQQIQQQQATIAQLQATTLEMRETVVDTHQHMRQMSNGLAGYRLVPVSPAAPAEASGFPPQQSEFHTAHSIPSPPASTLQRLTREATMRESTGLTIRIPALCQTASPPRAVASSEAPAAAPSISNPAAVSLPSAPTSAPATAPSSPLPALPNDRRLQRENCDDPRVWAYTTQMDLSSRIAATVLETPAAAPSPPTVTAPSSPLPDLPNDRRLQRENCNDPRMWAYNTQMDLSSHVTAPDSRPTAVVGPSTGPSTGSASTMTVADSTRSSRASTPASIAAPQLDAAADDLELAYPSPESTLTPAAEVIDSKTEDAPTSAAPVDSASTGSSPIGKKRARQEDHEGAEGAPETSEESPKRRKVTSDAGESRGASRRPSRSASPRSGRGSPSRRA